MAGRCGDDLTAGLFVLLDNGDLKAPMQQGVGRRKSRRTCADDDNVSALAVLRHIEIFFLPAHTHVQRALAGFADPRVGHERTDAV